MMNHLRLYSAYTLMYKLLQIDNDGFIGLTKAAVIYSKWVC